MQHDSERLQRERDAIIEENQILKGYLDILKKDKDAEIEALKTQIESLENALRNPSKEASNQGPPGLHKINSGIYVSDKYKEVAQLIGTFWKSIPGVSTSKAENLSTVEEGKNQSEKTADFEDYPSPKIVDGIYTRSDIESIKKEIQKELDMKRYLEVDAEFKKSILILILTALLISWN